VGRDRRGVAVGEVHLRPRGDPFGDRSVHDPLEAVPSDVRHLDGLPVAFTAAKPAAGAAQHAEPFQLGRLFAVLVEPPQPETDPEEGTAFSDARQDGLHPLVAERRGCGEVSDTGHDDALGIRQIAGSLGRENLGSHRRERLAHRGEIARLVVDQSNSREHKTLPKLELRIENLEVSIEAPSLLNSQFSILISNFYMIPLVLGSIFASRLSFAHATRRARANALNEASIL